VTIAGLGLGLRSELFGELLASMDEGSRLPVDFFEVSPENFMNRGGRYDAVLHRVRAEYPVVTHGLTMSLGGHEPLGEKYLRELRAFVHDVASPWHSDHVCFGAVSGRRLHELLPVSHKRANVGRIADRIRRAQDVLGVPLAVENVSSYWHPGAAEMGEAEFLAAVCDAADCGLLLDVNNAYVNATNSGHTVSGGRTPSGHAADLSGGRAADVDAWMAAAPLERVVQIHVAGHEWFAVDERGIGAAREAGAAGAMVIDTHGAEVAPPVLALLGRVLARTGPVPVLLERDQNIPSLAVLLEELGRIRAVCAASGGSQWRAEEHAAIP
jgi:uncharacterized protein (UPF0276 family)